MIRQCKSARIFVGDRNMFRFEEGAKGGIMEDNAA